MKPPAPFRPARPVLLALVVASLAVARRSAAEGTPREFRPEASMPANPAVEALMKRLREAQASTKTMAADFRQVKEDELFAKPRVQGGHFFFTAPGNFRWDYHRPDEVTVLVTADTIQRYVPKQKTVQQMTITKNQRRVFTFLGIGSDVELLRRHFDATINAADQSYPDTDKLELRGKARRVTKRINVLEMWIDRKTGLPDAIRAVMADGAKTTWEFTNVSLNGTLPAEAYKLDLPKDVIVKTDTGKAGKLIDGMVEVDDDKAAPSPAGG